jgi:hypothetical protein
VHNPKYNEIAKATVGLVFLGTPHTKLPEASEGWKDKLWRQFWNTKQRQEYSGALGTLSSHSSELQRMLEPQFTDVWVISCFGTYDKVSSAYKSTQAYLTASQ